MSLLILQSIECDQNFVFETWGILAGKKMDHGVQFPLPRFGAKPPPSPPR